MPLGKRVFINIYQKMKKSNSVFRCLLLCICSSLPESPAIKNPALLIILSSLSGKTWLINWTNWPRRCTTYHVKLVQKAYYTYSLGCPRMFKLVNWCWSQVFLVEYTHRMWGNQKYFNFFDIFNWPKPFKVLVHTALYPT